MKKKVLLISTGGTIAGKVAQTKREGENIKEANEFAEVLSSAIESIKDVNDIEVNIEHEPLCDIDSSDIKPEQWISLASLIKEKYNEFDSFIITHGTNTLGYTCAALSFALPNLGKPVILTGSQVPAGMPGSDAITNLENALRMSVLKREDKPNIIGVVAVFGSFIISGTRVKKSTEFDYDAFKSFNSGALGRIGRIIDMDDDNLEKHIGYLSTGKYRPAKKADELICENEFDMRIASFTEFPGMSSDFFKALVDRCDVKGFILRAFGAGDASTKHVKAFEYLKENEIPIVITTQAPNGNSNFQVNEPGENLKKKDLAIPAYDMSMEAMTTKLAWLLAKKEKNELTYKGLCEEMVNDIRGEVKIMWEVKM